MSQPGERRNQVDVVQQSKNDGAQKWGLIQKNINLFIYTHPNESRTETSTERASPCE